MRILLALFMLSILAGVAQDPESVQPDSGAEDSFIACMNGSGWCTVAFDCNKPSA